MDSKSIAKLAQLGVQTQSIGNPQPLEEGLATPPQCALLRFGKTVPPPGSLAAKTDQLGADRVVPIWLVCAGSPAGLWVVALSK
jgi:hypothetical protein